tara:strand:- start:1203 stop:1595 length:393 start_codon:yes stop_codon:yes gene_type:complete
MQEIPYRNNAELREEIAELRGMVDALQHRDDPARFQSELEDIIRAQHSIEQILNLLREINPSILAVDPHDGRTLIGHVMHSMNDLNRALRHQYRNVFPNVKWKQEHSPMMDLLKEIGQMAREFSQSDFEI